jgi:hypothetical protein
VSYEDERREANRLVVKLLGWILGTAILFTGLVMVALWSLRFWKGSPWVWALSGCALAVPTLAAALNVRFLIKFGRYSMSPIIPVYRIIITLGLTVLLLTLILAPMARILDRRQPISTPTVVQVNQPIPVMVIAKDEESRKRNLGPGCPVQGVEGVAIGGELRSPLVIIRPVNSECPGRKLVVTDAIGWAVPYSALPISPSGGAPTEHVDRVATTVVPEVIKGIVEAISLVNAAGQSLIDVKTLLLDDGLRPLLRSFSEEAGKSLELALVDALSGSGPRKQASQELVIDIRSKLMISLTADLSVNWNRKGTEVHSGCTPQSPAEPATVIAEALSPALASGLAQAASLDESRVKKAVAEARAGISQASLHLADALKQYRPHVRTATLTLAPQIGIPGKSVKVEGIGSQQGVDSVRLILHGDSGGATGSVEVGRAQTDSDGYFSTTVVIPHRLGQKRIGVGTGVYSITALPSGCSASLIISSEPFTG